MQKILIILALITFLFGDNIYRQMTGESVFETVYAYLTRSSEPTRIVSPNIWQPDSNAIPPEMKQWESKSTPNPDEELRNLGWMSNQVHTYTRPGICETETPAGLNKIALQAVLFEEAGGAKKAFDGWYYQEITPFGPITSNNQVGESAYTYWANYVNDECSTHHDLRVFSILFKRHNAIGIVQLDGIIGTISEGELEERAIKLAQEMDSKMLEEGE